MTGCGSEYSEANDFQLIAQVTYGDFSYTEAVVHFSFLIILPESTLLSSSERLPASNTRYTIFCGNPSYRFMDAALSPECEVAEMNIIQK